MGQTLRSTTSATIYLTKVLEADAIDVPQLPETVQKVISLTKDPDSDASQIAKVIQTDPLLGGHVMRIANSAAYTPNSNIVSIQQAISRLGINEIGNIAFSTSMNSKLFNASEYQVQIKNIWEHALATALWSKEVARSMRSNVEAAFLCGLLHTIGRPVILQTLSENPQKDATPYTDEQLQTVFDQFEAAYSQAVSMSWELPILVAEAISFYRRYGEAPSASELAATVSFGSLLATHMLNPDEISIDDINEAPSLELINLYPDDIEKILENKDSIQSSMSSFSS